MMPAMIGRTVSLILVALLAGPVAMADDAGARLFVPIHHKCFQLSHEPFNEPIERAERALESEEGRLVIRDVGETARIA